jgi:hypothetical protein
MTITGSNNFPFNIVSTDSGSTNGPLVILDRTSATPASGDALGGVQFQGRDSANNVTNYGAMVATISDPTDGSEDSTIFISARTGGTLANEIIIGGGVALGAPTGGAKGFGTLNATAVYDDNVLLTCGPIELAKHGRVDLKKWDALVPDRHHPERTHDLLERREKKDGTGEEYVVVGKSTTPARVEKRQHHVMHQFQAMLDEGFDPRDPKSFVSRMMADGAVPGLMTEKEWGDMHAAGDKPDSGTMLSRTHLALDNLAVAFATAVQQIETLQKRLDALESARKK